MCSEFEVRNELRFEAIDARFDAVDMRFEAVAGRFDSVDSKFDTLEARLEAKIHQAFADQTKVLLGVYLGSVVTMVGGAVAIAKV